MRCLALDVGDRRIGVAVGEVLARPLTVIERRSKAEDFAALIGLIRQHCIERLIVGLPLNMDGSAGFQAQRTIRYTDQIKEALAQAGLCIEVMWWDERCTTERALEIRAQSGSRTHVDAVAAAVILQSYLDESEQG